jgi:hypothetical protein
MLDMTPTWWTSEESAGTGPAWRTCAVDGCAAPDRHGDGRREELHVDEEAERVGARGGAVGDGHRVCGRGGHEGDDRDGRGGQLVEAVLHD